jgi:hypothetical protein
MKGKRLAKDWVFDKMKKIGQGKRGENAAKT